MAAWKAATGRDAAEPAEVVRLEDGLWQCATGGVIAVTSGPQAFAAAISTTPAASGWARWQAEHGAIVTSRKHQSLRLEFLDRQVLRQCDGRRDLAAIVDGLMGLVNQGQLMLRGPDGQLQSEEQVRAALEALVPRSLHVLAQNALLVA